MTRNNVTSEDEDQSNRNSLLHADASEETNEEQDVFEGAEEHSTDSGAATYGNTPDEGEPSPVSTPHPLLKEIRLNETFVVRPNASGSQRMKWSCPPNPNPGPKLSPSASLPSPSDKEETANFSAEPKRKRRSRSSSPDLQSIDVKLAITQSGKKLTLQDLLNVAKDFNSGRVPKVSVDERSKILRRHQWELNSFLNTFILQLLLISSFTKVLSVRDAICYGILLGMVWSSCNLTLWKRRYQNFKEWKLVFESVLKADTWETEVFKRRLSCRHMTPHLVNLSASFGIVSLFSSTDYFLRVLVVAVGVFAVISIQFGTLSGILPSWRQFLILSSSLIYYRSSFVTTLLGNSMEEQTKFLHQPFISVGGDSVNNLSMSISIFPVLVGTCLLTTIKLSLNQFLRKTLPEMVLSLWIVKLVRESVECEIKEFYVGVGIGVVLLCAVMLLSSKIVFWKVAMGLVAVTIIIISTLILAQVLVINGGLEGESTMKFLEWEEYDLSCHRKAWGIMSPAATQIKCSTLFNERRNPVMVRWSGKISVVKVDKLSHSLLTQNVDDVVFDVGVGIFTGWNNKDEGGGSKWQMFLSGTSDNSESTAPASVIVDTRRIADRKSKQNLIDHILNLKSGDKIEFVGRLKGSTAGGLKPQIVDVRMIQCLSCQLADHGEISIVSARNTYGLMDLANWPLQFLGREHGESGTGCNLGGNHVLEDCKRLFMNFVKRWKSFVALFLTDKDV